MPKIIPSIVVLTALAACSTSISERLERSRLEIVDPTPDEDSSDAYFRDILTGETCKRRPIEGIGC